MAEVLEPPTDTEESKPRFTAEDFAAKPTRRRFTASDFEGSPSAPKTVTETTPKVSPSDMPKTPSATGFRPAIRLVGGEVLVGDAGTTHPDIIQENDLRAAQIDQRGFVDNDGKFFDREQTAAKTGLPTNKEPGRQHSTDLPEFEAPPGFTPPKEGETSIYEQPTFMDKPLINIGDSMFGKGRALNPRLGRVAPIGKVEGVVKEETGPVIEGVSETMKSAINSLTTPRNLAYMLGSLGVAATGTAGKILVSALWTGVMGKNAVEDAPKIYSELGAEMAKPEGQRDRKKIASLLTQSGLDVALAVAPAVHGVGELGLGDRPSIDLKAKAQEIAPAAPLTAQAVAQVADTTVPIKDVPEKAPIETERGTAIEPPQPPGLMPQEPSWGPETPPTAEKPATEPPATQEAPSGEAVTPVQQPISPPVPQPETPTEKGPEYAVQPEAAQLLRPVPEPPREGEQTVPTESSRTPDDERGRQEATSEKLLTPEEWEKRGVKFARRPDGTLKTKEEYTPDEWNAYTDSVIEAKLKALPTEPPVQEAPTKQDVTAKPPEKPPIQHQPQEWTPPTDFPKSDKEPVRLPDPDSEIERLNLEHDAADKASEPFWNKREVAKRKLDAAKHSYDDSKIATAQRALDRADAAWRKMDEAKNKVRQRVDDAKDSKWWDQATPFQKWIWRMQQEYFRIYGEGEQASREAVALADKTKAVIEREWEKAVERQGFTPEQAKDLVRRRFTLTSSVWSDPLNPRNEINKMGEWTVKTFKEDTVREKGKAEIEALQIPSMNRPSITDYDSPEEVARKVEKAKATAKALKKEESERVKRKAESDEQEKARLRELQSQGKLVWRLSGEKQWTGVSGRSVKIPEAAALNFHAYKGDRGWVVLEETTGQSVGNGPTLQAALGDAKSKITKAGAQRVYEMVRQAQKGLPPKPDISPKASLEPTPEPLGIEHSVGGAVPAEFERSPGMTQLRVTDTKGKTSVQPIAEVRKGNPFKGVDISKVEAGAIDKTGKFKPIPGEIKVEAKPKKIVPAANDWTQATQPLAEAPESPVPAEGKGVPAELQVSILPGLSTQAGLPSLKPLLSSGVARAKSIWSEIRDLPAWSDFKESLLNWSGMYQRAHQEVYNVRRDLLRKVPNRLRREGMINWIQAGGDKGLLAQRAAATVDPKLKRGYEVAQQLTPEEQVIAQKVRDTYDILLQRAQKYGLVDEAKENYVTQIWKDDSGPMMSLLRVISGGRKLSKTFRFGLKSTFENYFEGEQAGFKPRNKDIAAVLPAYMQSLNKVIADRMFVENMSKGTASDGRPLLAPSGYVKQIEGATGDKATLVFPERMADPELKDYKVLEEQPALHKWMWRAKDESGNPVFVEGDLKVHPEIYSHLKNVLGRSAIRQWWESPGGPMATAVKSFTRLALDTVQPLAKELMMATGSPFHIVQEGTHGIFHRVNPFSVSKIDLLNNPEHMDAARHGVMLKPDRISMDAFREGLGGTRLIGKTPLVGPILDSWNHFVFEEYIPGLKYDTYAKLLDRNKGWYAEQLASGEVTLDQVKNLSAHQVNAAYGHLNYAELDRNPTFRHLTQMVALAPDFFEARGRFTAQAIKGMVSSTGSEQLHALAIGAGLFWLGSRILNKTVNDDWEFDHPFSLIMNGREYRMRSVPEDLWRMFHDTHQFFAGRLSPLVGRAGLELLTGRNYRGEKITKPEILGDLTMSFVPMWAQHFPGIRELSRTTANNPVSPWEAFVSTMGIQISRYSPITETYKLASAWKEKTGKPMERGTYPISKYQQLRYALEDGDYEKAWDANQTLLKDKKQESLGRGFKQSLFHPFTGNAKDENAFEKTLSGRELMIFKAAKERRRLLWQRYQQMLSHPPPVAPSPPSA